MGFVLIRCVFNICLHGILGAEQQESLFLLSHWKRGLCSSLDYWSDYFRVLKLTLDVMVGYGHALRDLKKKKKQKKPPKTNKNHQPTSYCCAGNICSGCEKVLCDHISGIRYVQDQGYIDCLLKIISNF